MPTSRAEELEDAQVDLVAAVKSSIDIPLAVKLSPFYTVAAPFRAADLCRPARTDWCSSTASTSPTLTSKSLSIAHTLDLSTPADLRLPLRWISILHGSVDVDLALTSGIHTHEGVLKAMMAGAKVAMMASELLHERDRRDRASCLPG